MKNLLIAIGLSVALPALAHAQTNRAPAPKADCLEAMKDKACKDMDHSGMNHSGAAKDAKPDADPDAGHDVSKADKAGAPAPADHQH